MNLWKIYERAFNKNIWDIFPSLKKKMFLNSLFALEMHP